jgi:integrase
VGWARIAELPIIGKSRLVPLHPTTRAALRSYAERRSAHLGSRGSTYFFVAPRVHDFRHNSGNRIIPATDRQQLYFGENRGVAGT